MGYGSYSAASYSATIGAKIASGTSFAYDSAVRSSGKYEAHETLDPIKLNKAGLNIREARDSAEHPNTKPISIGLDVTGSMARTPRIVQENLRKLFGLLVRKGYCEDPALQISAYGDAFSDYVPLQVSQFESNNNLDIHLDNLFLEGHGGNNGGETATLLWYYLNNHVVTDAWEKRGQKGYFFLIADEIALDLTPEQVKSYIGAEEAPAAHDLTAQVLAEKLKEKWEVFVLLLDNGSAFRQGSKKFYTDLFGAQRIVVLEDDTTVSETIGAIVGRMENDDLDDDELIDDMLEEGISREAATKAAKAVAKLGSGTVSGSVAKTGLTIKEDDGGVEFL
jgi:hypothetical protein